jgi:hypothetical protein
MQDSRDGFSWTPAQATSLYANYLMFVYSSPLIGGWLADKVLGYRKAVMIGGFFFMAGHGLLSIPALWAVYAALTCLVIGNGFFKPNVSTMVGNLYPEGSHLKDRAYNIFYMGINVGALAAPIVMEIVKARWGFHPAFAVAAFGMVISVSILWRFKRIVEDPASSKQEDQHGCPRSGAGRDGEGFDARRIGALIVIFYRYRLLDGLSPEWLDVDVLGGRQHGLERDRYDFKRHQPGICCAAHLPTRMVLEMAGQKKQRALDPDEDGHWDDFDGDVVLHPLRRGEARRSKRGYPGDDRGRIVPHQ